MCNSNIDMESLSLFRSFRTSVQSKANKNRFHMPRYSNPIPPLYSVGMKKTTLQCYLEFQVEYRCWLFARATPIFLLKLIQSMYCMPKQITEQFESKKKKNKQNKG